MTGGGGACDELLYLADRGAGDAAAVATTVGRAVTAMQLDPPPMCFAPNTANTGAVGLVGMFAWAWICPEQVRESTVGPVHRTAVGPGIVVTATAINTAVAITWGDGSLPTICAGPALPFIPYTDAAGGLPSPVCGHHIGKSSITAPNQLFHLTATSMWIIYWTAATPEGAASGVIPMPLTSRYNHRIGEAQILNAPAPPR